MRLFIDELYWKLVLYENSQQAGNQTGEQKLDMIERALSQNGD